MSERVIVDKGGRIVIPKSLRARLGLREGDLLVVEAQGGDLVVRQEEEEDGLVRRGKRLFKPQGAKAGTLDSREVDRLIEIMRDPDARRGLEMKEATAKPSRKIGKKHPQK